MLKRLWNLMFRAQSLTLAGACWLALASFVGEAGAAFIQLVPISQPLPGPAVFEVFLDGLSAPAIDASISLHFDAAASVDQSDSSGDGTGNLFASAAGDPFLLGANLTTTPGACPSGIVLCWVGGGSQLGGPGIPGPIKLGRLTLASPPALGLAIDIIVSPTSRWTPEGGAPPEDVTNIGTVVARLPEPLPLLLVAIALFALAAVVRGRAPSRRR